MINKDNQEGYTFVKFLVFIAVFALLLLILIPTVNEAQKEKNETNDTKKDEIIMSAEKYINDNKEYFNEYFKEKNMIYRINTKDLVKSNYLSKNDSKQGYVNIIDNKYFNFVLLDNEDTLDKKIVIDENGINNENSPFDLKYVFKDNENNYLKYNDKTYRIIGVTNSNHLKLINLEETEKSYGLGENINWFEKKDDNNFSKELNYNSDKGIFYVGYVRSSVNNIKEIMKNEKRNNEYTIKVPKYYGNYALSNLSDIINASETCEFNSLTEINLTNCNSYLLETLKGSIILNTGEDQKVYMIDDLGNVCLTDNLKNAKVHEVIYLNAVENFEGNGTLDNPYVLKVN